MNEFMVLVLVSVVFIVSCLFAFKRPCTMGDNEETCSETDSEEEFYLDSSGNLIIGDIKICPPENCKGFSISTE